MNRLPGKPRRSSGMTVGEAESGNGHGEHQTGRNGNIGSEREELHPHGILQRLFDVPTPGRVVRSKQFG